MLHSYQAGSRTDLVRGPDGEGPVLDGQGNPFFKTRAKGMPRVLIVDDEMLIADTLTQIFNMHGFDAFCSYSGEQALQLAESFQPDYLLADVMMPQLDGIDLAVAVAMERKVPDLKVLLFSGQESSMVSMHLEKVTGQGFSMAAKPIHPDELVEKLRSVRPRL